jgi:class 3 adenylate cyclase/tetratricopeptide (TPR) repeat protein
MKCSKCQFENRQGINFCEQCGMKIAWECPQCKEMIPSDTLFCGFCGCKNPTPSFGSHPTVISQSERKHVTVLFCDLTGYTAMSEKLDPEELKEIMGRIFGEIAQVVVKYEGFIEKFVGDAVMVMFGIPRTHEDDPVRAIKAALEIHEIIRDMSPSLEQRIGGSISMHTGINTGLVITGDVDFHEGKHGVLGDTINVAARLLGLAKADEIVVGLETWHQAQGFFHFKKLDSTHLKGKRERIQIYKVIGPKGEPTKIHRLSGLSAELVGRKAEMALLWEALNDLKQGKGSVVSIVGDAGTGKSRLVEEFRRSSEWSEILWRQMNAYAYAQNIPYFPIIDLMNRTWRIQEGDSQQEIKQKIESVVGTLLGERADLIPYVGSLLSLKYQEIEEVGPEYWKVRLHEAVHLILANLSRKTPTVICIEDLHWADPSSVELLGNILSGSNHAILFICTYRPVFKFSNICRINAAVECREIVLRDLSPADAQHMVESLLKTKNVPAELKRFIWDKVEGNPFYIEEMINSLIESGVLDKRNNIWALSKPLTTINIPSTVQGVISARLDRLEKEPKRILQEAAVIGRSFQYDILESITELKEHLNGHINSLEGLDFIRTGSSLQPEQELIFKHALTQEVVYNGLLKKERQDIHEKIGRVMEEHFQDRLPEYYEALAYHFKQGRSRLKAVYYLTQAGEKNRDRYAVDEAHQYYREAFELLLDAPDKTAEMDLMLMDVFLSWSVVYYHRADYNQMLDILKRYESFAVSLEDKARLGMYYVWMGAAFGRLENLREGYQYLHKALAIGEEIENEKIICYACTWLSMNCSDLGLMDEAINFGTRVHRMDMHLADKNIFRLSTASIGYAHYFKGEPHEVYDAGLLLLDYGQRYDDMGCMVHGHTCLGMSYLVQGDYPSAIECFKKSIKAALEPVFTYTAKLMLGVSYVANGQHQQAENVLHEIETFNEGHGYGFVGTIAKGLYGIVQITRGNLQQGVGIVEDAIDFCRKNESMYRYATLHLTLGKIYMQIVQGGEKKDITFFVENFWFLVKTIPFAGKKAEYHLRNAMIAAQRIGSKGIEAQAALELGRLFKIRGKKRQAKQYIADAIRIFEQTDAVVFLKQSRELLASVG